MSCSSAPIKSSAQNRTKPKASSTPAAIKTSNAAPVSQEESSAQNNSAYLEIQKLYKASQCEKVISKSLDFEKKNKDKTNLAYVRNIHGLCYLTQRKPLEAVAQFQRIIEDSPSLSIKPYVLYNLASAFSDADQPDDSLETLKEIDPEHLQSEIRAKYYSLKAKNYLFKNNWIESARSTLGASQTLGAGAGEKPALAELLDRALSQVQKSEDLHMILSGYENAPLSEKIKQRLGQSAAQVLGSNPTANARAVGVLLPLSGKFATYGERALKAIAVAFQSFNQNSDFTLEIEDAGETPEQAVRGLQRLATQRNASLVIGPLLSKGIEQITASAQMLGIPLLTLAQQSGTKNDWTIAAGLTPKLQTESIAKAAVEKLKLKRFVILHPRDKFGEQYAQSFWDAVEEMGGEIVGIESYKTGETDFRAPIDRLTGTFYQEARAEELKTLADKRTELNITKRNRKTTQYFDLTPIIDFDAVFIPDEPKTISLILPTFAFRDIEKIKLLGISTWNSPELIERAKEFAEDTVFVDGLFADSKNVQTQKFITDYLRDGNDSPTTIEAMAYDAALTAKEVLSSFSPGNILKEEVRSKLSRVSDINGATGELSAKNGELKRELTVLTVKSGQIQQF